MSLPDGHNLYLRSCTDLAYVLRLRSEHTLSNHMLDKARAMHIRALAANLHSHSDQARLFVISAKSFWSTSSTALDPMLLDETIRFGRALLSSALQHHPQQLSPLSRLNIAVLLWIRSSSASSRLKLQELEEAESLYHAFLKGQQELPCEWLAHIGLARLYLDHTFSRYSSARALVYLFQATLPRFEPDNLICLVQELASVSLFVSSIGTDRMPTRTLCWGARQGCTAVRTRSWSLVDAENAGQSISSACCQLRAGCGLIRGAFRLPCINSREITQA
jgi:hypothetical protein